MFLLVAAGCSSSGDPGPRKCRLHSDCALNERCVDGHCEAECREDRDCGDRAPCVSGACVGGQADGGAWPLDGGGPVADGASGDGGAGTPGNYGDPCNRAGDCLSGYCVSNKLTGEKICTIECATEAVCQEAHACLPVPRPTGGTVNVCVPSDAGSPCPDGQGTTCIYGLCLLHPAQQSQSICSTPCTSARACPVGYSCSLVNVGSRQERVCMPVGIRCSAQGQSTQCLSRWCSTQAQRPSDGICTANCRTAADCPRGWACGWDDLGPQTVVDVCQPLLRQGQLIACTVDAQNRNDCYSKTCATDTGTTGYCTAFCMDVNFTAQPERCPTGWRCVAVDLGGATGYACEAP